MPVARIVRSSHERWDGGGYPDGLAGDAIPVGARIVHVCDRFEAIVAEQRLSAPDALAALRAESGTSFDPEVVDALATVVAERRGVGASAAQSPTGNAR
jgi:response regulator RpfG family c-di-GMP phosphodiesterase